MNIVFKIMVFSIMLNFATGVMQIAIPAFDETVSNVLPDYDSTYADGFIGEMNGSVTPSGELEDKGNAIYRVLDMLNIGFISKFLSTVDYYMFGFVNVLYNLVGGLMEESLSRIMFGTIKVIMSLGYLIGAWVLWTGKDIQSN